MNEILKKMIADLDGKGKIAALALVLSIDADNPKELVTTANEIIKSLHNQIVNGEIVIQDQQHCLFMGGLMSAHERDIQ